jgi:four helix bundle protein
MGDIRTPRKLDVWKRAMGLSKGIYRATGLFPASEQFGLTSQMKRTVESIASNLAEGAARASKREFLQFINVAQGSASELDTQVEWAKELGFLDQKIYQDFSSEITVVSKQLFGLSRSMRTR